MDSIYLSSKFIWEIVSSVGKTKLVPQFNICPDTSQMNLKQG